MWQEDAYANVYKSQDEGECRPVLQHWNGHILQSLEGDWPQFNAARETAFTHTMQPGQIPNNALFVYEDGQPQQSNFDSPNYLVNNAIYSHRQTSNGCEVGDEVYMKSTTNNDCETGVFLSGGNNFYCNDRDEMRGIKRKGEDYYNPYFPTAKLHITDERMAAGMNNLHITNDHSYCSASMFDPNNSFNMEFNSTAIRQKDELLYSDERSRECSGIKESVTKARRDYPVFQFSAPLESILKKKSEILPEKIINEICKPCMAVVPWTPPLETDDLSKEDQEKKTNAKIIAQGTEVEAMKNRCSVSTMIPNFLDDEDVGDDMEL